MFAGTDLNYASGPGFACGIGYSISSICPVQWALKYEAGVAMLYSQEQVWFFH